MFAYDALLTFLPMYLVDILSHFMGIAHLVAFMFGIRSSISLFQDVPRYNDALELSKCTATGVKSGHCSSVMYEIMGTTMVTLFFTASHNRADPYVDNVLEPILLGVTYFIYILYVSPSMFYNGVLFGLMEAAKPAHSIFMMYVPMVLQNWLGVSDHEMLPV